jgi:ribosome biogenesis GTPase / thiamine phosphate phosphatase
LSLHDLGWGEPFASALHDLHRPELVAARVLAVHRGALACATDDGGVRLAPVRGALDEPPAVGDWVALDDAGAIAAVLERRSALRRERPEGGAQVLAANVDVAFVVTAADRDLNARRLERFVAVAGAGGAEAVLVLAKADLAADLPAALAVVRGAAPGRPVLVTSAPRGIGLDGLAAVVGRGRTAVLLGSSGVGKSTLVNALLGAERQATRPVRVRDDRGRHTTTHRELFVLPAGGLIIDTPGLRLPRLAHGGDGVAGAFADVEALAGHCRFADCAHDREPGCAVRAAVADGTMSPARLRHHRSLAEEQRRAQRRQAERRGRRPR